MKKLIKLTDIITIIYIKKLGKFVEEAVNEPHPI